MRGLVERLKARLQRTDAPAAADAGAPPAGADDGASASAERTARARALVTQGNALEDRGELASACALYREAVHLAPGLADAHLNLGIGLAAAGDAAGARAAYEALLALEPAHPFGHYNYANLVAAQGDLRQAETLVRRALAARADFPQAHLLLSNVLDSQGDAAGAEQALRAALAVNPQYAGAHYNLAMLMRRLQRPDDALAAARDAAAADPQNADAQALFGSLLIEHGLALEALAPLRQAIALAPGNLELRSRELFLLNLDESLSAEALFRQHCAVGALLEQAVPARYAGRWTAPRDPQRRLRIAFVSGDLRVHPVSLFLLPLLERLDRSRFEVVCCSRGAAQDHITERLRALSDHWVDASGLDNAALAQAIHGAAVDILVDLLGHTGEFTVPVYCEQPAPVQVAWVGYLNTTGLARMGYRLCDDRTDPPAVSAPLHTERLVALPFSQWCYRPFVEVEPPAAAPPAADGAITFGSFNQAAKVTPSMARRWARILQRVAGSRLLVAGVASTAKQASVLAAMQEEGVAPACVQFAPRMPLPDYLRLIASVDIALDAYPYGGGTTTFDALYMGVPVVTATGDTPASRSAASILAGLDLRDWIAGSIDDYEELAVRKAADRAAISQLRASLRPRLQASGFMAEERFVRDFEAALRTMWRRYCEGAAPA
jgi:protein O-GlcNAc transferase